MASDSATAATSAYSPRPSGFPSTTPPPSLPLTFFGAAFVGLVACGVALVLAHGAGITDPTSDPLVAAAHFGMLATLSMGILGALHQFAPVVTQRPLRSVFIAWMTFVTWLSAAWLLPLGFGTQHEVLVEVGGGFAAIAITLLVINLWTTLRVKGKGAPVIGLRLAVVGFIITACFGVVYVSDRRGNWFDLSGHVVLAHATIGIFAWLGLTYVSVAEKLWPMFLLAHVPGKHRSGVVGIISIPMGVALLSPGLLFEVPFLAWVGAVIISIGLGAHLVSLAAHLRHRKRKADLYLVFVVTAAVWIIAGVLLAIASALVIPNDFHLGIMLAAASIVAFGGWILEAFIGHIHKVIPFVIWSMFRRRGIDKNLSGNQLMFGDLYNHQIAAVVYGCVTIGVGLVCLGLASSVGSCLVVGGSLLSLAGVLLAINFSATPIYILRIKTRTGKVANGEIVDRDLGISETFGA